jgi:preprotein translocase subunit SecE
VAKKDEAEVKGQKDAKASKDSKESKEVKDKKAEAAVPSRQQLISESLAVILMVTLSATLIYLVDNFFSWAAKQVFG